MFDTFYSLETAEQRVKYLDDTFTPIVQEAVTEFKDKYNLPGNFTKDVFFEESSGYGATYELAHGARCILRVMLYSDPDYRMQNYYWVHLYLGWAKDSLTKGLSKEDILETLDSLKQASEKEAKS